MVGAAFWKTNQKLCAYGVRDSLDPWRLIIENSEIRVWRKGGQ